MAQFCHLKWDTWAGLLGLDAGERRKGTSYPFAALEFRKEEDVEGKASGDFGGVEADGGDASGRRR